MRPMDEIIDYNRYHAYRNGFRDGVASKAMSGKFTQYPEYEEGYTVGRLALNDALRAYLNKNNLNPPSILR